ncbi:DUF1643 domain-containing protein [Flaviaesturariibacter amylovorans]|uniref:DUF1643 domain-containing protein n=1 Tax=Flaviaesturariibacter amylovorans TaxID=1084520 RepID=A0ABP8GQ88_9BACT
MTQTLFEPIRSADFSPCGQYRYRLQRIWDRSRPIIAFMGLNPSTANAETDDPTIRRVIGFAKREGYGGVSMYNLFNVVSPDPKVLLTHPDPLGPDGWKWLAVVSLYPKVVLCWGAFPEAKERAAEVLQVLTPGALYCLGKTAAGHPKHPLYLPSDSPLIKF